MKPLKVLPQNYEFSTSLDLIKDQKTLVKVNILAIIGFFVFGWLFLGALTWLRPETVASGFSYTFSGLTTVISRLLSFLVVVAIMVVLHEFIHGILFWMFTREIPKVAFKGFYAYAAAPGWFIPRNQYLLVGIGPFLIITLVGIGLIVIVPQVILFPLLILLTLNASGSAGDLLAVGWLLRHPATSYIEDQGVKTSVYVPQKQESL